MEIFTICDTYFEVANHGFKWMDNNVYRFLVVFGKLAKLSFKCFNLTGMFLLLLECIFTFIVPHIGHHNFIFVAYISRHSWLVSCKLPFASLWKKLFEITRIEKLLLLLLFVNLPPPFEGQY